MARPRLPTFRFAGQVLLFCAVILIATEASSADLEDGRFLEGLRARRLFALAEAHCRQRLGEQDIDDADRADLVIELVRTFASHAINSPPQDRGPLWQQAQDVVAEFGNRYPNNPRLVLVRVQDALTLLAHGELARQEAEVGAGQANALDNARQQIREAARRLKQIDGELTKDIPLRRRTPPPEGGLSADELLSLQNNVRYQLARAYRNQALCYEKDSTDRVAALAQAIDQLNKPLTQLPETDPLVGPIRIDLVVSYRLLGDLPKAAAALSSLQQPDAPPAIQLRARAEAVRLLLAAARPQEALNVLREGRKIGNHVSAEFDFAHLETYEVLAKVAADAKDEAQAADWQKRAVAMTRLIEETHGPYWGRRANLLLVRSAEQGGGVRDLEILVRTGDNFYLRGQLDEALSSYDKAGRMAQAAGDGEQTFVLQYKAALVEQKRQRYGEASRRLRELSLALKTHPQAADAHLLACWNASRVVEIDPTAANHYVALLGEHLQAWPKAESADKARMWLGRMLEYRRAWNEAIAAYLGVSRVSDQFAPAVEAAARSAQQWLSELKDAGQPLEQQAESVARAFEDVILEPGGQFPQRWTDAARSAALTAARIRLQFTTGGHAAVTGVLQAALDGEPEAPDAWKTSARSLLVVALAAQGNRREEARQRLQQLAGGSPTELLEMLDGLSAIGQSSRPEVRAELAQLQLDAVTLLLPQRHQLDKAGQTSLDRVRAEALASAGRRAEALLAYEALAKENAGDGRTQEGYAEFLLAATDRPTLEKALSQWRLVAGRSRPQTDRWFRAKYSVALAQYKLGDKTGAAQLIRYLQETPPGLDGCAMKDDFAKLLKLCEQ